jgi:hypothetical protein
MNSMVKNVLIVLVALVLYDLVVKKLVAEIKL